MFQEWFDDGLTNKLALSWGHSLMFYFCLLQHKNIKTSNLKGKQKQNLITTKDKEMGKKPPTPKRF